ncbi:hypothetical protein HY212_02270 [Candidatus Pacearchaeota archaeon]|nr:hypothetical protein [Candidatus Pacearchaeota archaeon]
MVNKKFMIVIGLLALVGVVIFFILSQNNKDKGIRNVINEVFGGKDNSGNLDNSTNNNDGQTNNFDKGSNSGLGSSGGSGSGGSGDQGSSSGAGCIKSQISYSLENIKVEQTCNAFNGEICTDKTVKCSIEVHNLDNGIGGNFGVRVSFVEEGKETESQLDAKSANFIIGPNEFKQYNESINLHGSNENDPPNKNIKCLYVTLEVPKQEVC